MDQHELGSPFRGLRAILTVADERGCIIAMNDVTIEHDGDQCGELLLGTDYLGHPPFRWHGRHHAEPHQYG